jgi:hypothetical protein
MNSANAATLTTLELYCTLAAVRPVRLAAYATGGLWFGVRWAPVGRRPRGKPGRPARGSPLKGGNVSNAVTMRDLELEQAELLPSRETLNCCNCHRSSGFNFSQVGVGQGNTNQVGLLNVSLLNGDFSGNEILL